MQAGGTAKLLLELRERARLKNQKQRKSRWVPKKIIKQ